MPNKSINDKMMEKIIQLQKKTPEQVNDLISSVSMSFDDYAELRGNDPYGCIVIHVIDGSQKPFKGKIGKQIETWRGYRLFVGKVTRINLKWTPLTRYARRTKNSFKCLSSALISVQPMAAPIGKVFYMDYKYSPRPIDTVGLKFSVV